MGPGPFMAAYTKMPMERKIKMIWDFRGPGAEQTARHHKIHLDEFAQARNLDFFPSGVEPMAEFHWTAYLVVGESQVPGLREILKPHRGQVHIG